MEDIVDTGLTLGFLVEHIRARGARSVDVCALLDRPVRRILPLPVRYVGRRSPTCSCSGTASTWPTSTATSRAWSKPIGRCWPSIPRAYVDALYPRGSAGES